MLDAEEVVAVLQLSRRGRTATSRRPAALGDDDAVGAADSGTTTFAVTECDLFLMLSTQFSLTRMPVEQQLGVAADQLRAPGDVGVDPLESAVVERDDVVLDRLDQPKPLQLSQFLRVVGGQIVGLGPVVGAVEFPDVVVERRRRVGLPRRAVLGHRRPALVVDAAVAHHLEVLDVVRLRCLRRRAACPAC